MIDADVPGEIEGWTGVLVQGASLARHDPDSHGQARMEKRALQQLLEELRELMVVEATKRFIVPEVEVKVVGVGSTATAIALHHRPIVLLELRERVWRQELGQQHVPLAVERRTQLLHVPSFDTHRSFRSHNTN